MWPLLDRAGLMVRPLADMLTRDADGRVLLGERRRLIVTADGVRTERSLGSEAEERDALHEWFGIELSPDP